MCCGLVEIRVERRLLDFRTAISSIDTVTFEVHRALGSAADCEAVEKGDKDSGKEVKSITAIPSPVCPVIARRTLSFPSATRAS